MLPLHQVTNLPRAGRGGGIAVITGNGINILNNKRQCYVSFEYLDLTLSVGKVSFRLISIYRPPSSVKNESRIGQFISDFSDLIDRIFTSGRKVVLVGDFNIHLEIPSDPQTILFNEILALFTLQQHVNGPTHCCGHTLDLIITRQMDSSIIASTQFFSDTLSDHSYILCEICFSSPRLPKIQISSRNIKSVRIDEFVQDLQLQSFGSDCDSVDDLVDYYNIILRMHLISIRHLYIEQCRVDPTLSGTQMILGK